MKRNFAVISILVVFLVAYGLITARQSRRQQELSPTPPIPAQQRTVNSPGTAPDAAAVDETPAPIVVAPATTGSYELTPAEGGTFIFGPTGDVSVGSVRLFLDNGLDKPVTVTFEGRTGFPVTVPASASVLVRTRPCLLRFATCAADGTQLDKQQAALAADGVYVYNPLAAWDYTIATHYYSTVPFGNGPSERTISGSVLFNAAPVDFPFEAAPASITVSTFGGFGQDSRTTLDHGGNTAEGRTCRSVANPAGATLGVVVVSDQELALTGPADSAYAAPTARITIDSGYDDAVSVRVDGFVVTELPGGAMVTLDLAPGPRRIEVLGPPDKVRDAVTPTLEAWKNQVFSPEGRRTYIGSIGEQNHDCAVRGLRFFATEAPLDQAGSFRRGAAGDFRPAIALSYNAIVAEAKEALGAKGFPAFERRLPRSAATAPSDLDVFFVRGLLAEARGDPATALAQYDAVLHFAPTDAAVYKCRAILRARMAGSATLPMLNDIQADLEKAAELDPAKDPALEAMKAAIGKAIERQEEAERKAEEKAAKEAPAEEAEPAK